MTSLATFVCVWHPETEELLFEGSSSTVGLEEIRSVVGHDSFPEDPEMIAVHPITRDQGMKLIDMMGFKFEGDGEFQISRELVD
ncbi:hypothetical protein ACVIGB_000654 [Bradyrhizobium sp. USDA 4341]